jgi:hypothetical protein
MVHPSYLNTHPSHSQTSTLLGDFIVTHDFVRVFLVDAKTDNYKSGQWATFSVSPTETSAYVLLHNLVKNMVTKDVKIDMVDNISQTYGENHQNEKLWINFFILFIIVYILLYKYMLVYITIYSTIY